MGSTLYFFLIIAALIIAILYARGDLEGFAGMDGLVKRDLPTAPQVQMIQGMPDFDVVDAVSGKEMIRDGDIALSPGIGIGEGTVGFGRYGSSWIM
jgi:hypothetical protein